LYACAANGEWVRLDEDGWLASDSQAQTRRKDRVVISLLYPQLPPKGETAATRASGDRNGNGRTEENATPR
jgi:hypothetical protein